MLKNNLFIFIFITTSILFESTSLSQIPFGYYDSAEGLIGEELKLALNNIIKDHIEFPYTSGSTDVWDLLKETDRDPDNPNNVILFYTGESVNAAQEYNNGNGWDREHIWAKSRGNFGTTKGAGTDVHALRACNIQANTDRSNRWFANSTTPHFLNNNPTGCYYDNQNFTWQPRENEKGDVARMIFYMAVRYEGNNGEPDLEIVDYFPNQFTNAPLFALLSDLLSWNEDDPVDDFERERNDIIYYDYQQNRNPFIDHPEYAEYIWGESSGVSAIESVEIEKQRELIKMVDIMGRETNYKPNSLLFYMYSDGTVQKVISNQ